MRCGLLGRQLGHSYSPQIHAHLGDYSYTLFEREPEQIEDFLKHDGFTAINVTVPYKKEVIPFLDSLTSRAEKMGAVNTVVRKNGKLIGHNTDFYGFHCMLKESGLAVRDKKVLVLGSGGASNTVVQVLQAQGAQTVVISRSGENHYNNLHLHADASVIVNTTPVGMYPNPGTSALSLDLFPALEGVLDLIYNPSRTKLLQDAENRGLIARNGLFMLVAQAKEAAEWFLDRAISDDVIPRIHRHLAAQTENIILIGMPGCGKTTIGKLLAEKLNKPFLDADMELMRMAGRSIPEIFAQDGESTFRQLETETLAALGMRSGTVIATGGGCVTRRENYPLLHQNGTIVWLNRDISKLPTEGRPLSQTNRLSDMWQTRQPLYKEFADIRIDNNTSAGQTVAAIVNQLGRSL